MSVTYTPAEAPQEIALSLIETDFDRIRDYSVRVECWFRDDLPKRKGKLVLADIQKVSGVEAAARNGGIDFYRIRVTELMWIELTPKQREALLFHELCHVKIKIKKNGEPNFTTIGHDLEEFERVVEKYGLWYPDVETFARVVAKKMSQQQLFLDTAAGGA